MSRRSDLVDASVPNEWLPRFVGHRIWSRPEAKPGAHAEWVDLLDMWEEETEDPGYPYRFWALIQWRGDLWPALLAQQMHVQGVDKAECTPFEWDRGDETVTHWSWTPPFDDPPVWPRHPKGWKPSQSSQDHAEDFPIVDSDVGEQFVLFNI